MNKRDDSIYLQHILDAIKKIEEYLQGIEEERFAQNTLIQDGVIRQLEIIGEAVKNLSMDLRSHYTGISWKDIAGMRDKLIHHYFGVDLNAVWTTATEDVPVFKEEIQRILKELRPNTS
ncbi:MAG: DUF86 domain-containing protein [bacterium]|nr:DUF86 domain-containing protein [bacterium]